MIRAYAASGSPFPELTIDLTGARTEGTLFLDGISNPALIRETGYFISPHPASIAITRLLAQLRRRFGISDATATVLLPASERGSAGVDELQEQTVGLLNFHDVERRIYGGQLAFNLLSEAPEAARIEERIQAQVRNLLQKEALPLRVVAIQAPVFHSHAIALFVTLDGPAAAEDVRECLTADRATLRFDGDAGKVSPVSVIGTDVVHVGRFFQDARDPDSFFFWLVADNLRIASQNALRIAESIILAPAAPQ
jgi:aspartate-semialdehyde dehydrogenase